MGKEYKSKETMNPNKTVRCCNWCLMPCSVLYFRKSIKDLNSVQKIFANISEIRDVSYMNKLGFLDLMGRELKS